MSNTKQGQSPDLASMDGNHQLERSSSAMDDSRDAIMGAIPDGSANKVHPAISSETARQVQIRIQELETEEQQLKSQLEADPAKEEDSPRLISETQSSYLNMAILMLAAVKETTTPLLGENEIRQLERFVASYEKPPRKLRNK